MIWLKNAFLNWERATDSDLQPSVPDDDLTKSTKEESGTCLLKKHILLSDGTLAPMEIYSG